MASLFVPRPSLSALAESFTPDFENGLLFWADRPAWHFPNPRIHRSFNAHYARKSALIGWNKYGCSGRLTLAGERYWLPRKHVLWAMNYGDWPAKELGHRNQDFHDDRIDNLREQDEWQKAAFARRMQSPTGVKGVVPTSNGRYFAQVRCLGESHNPGTFDTLEEARKAREDASRRLHGEFTRITGPIEDAAS